MAEADFDKALEAARARDWESMFAHAKLAPVSWDVFQQLPSVASGPDGAGPGLPNDVTHRILDHLTSRSSYREELLPQFIFELAGHLPAHADAKLLNRLADVGKHDFHMTEAVHEHPNWKADPRTQGLIDAGEFWNSYEREVRPHHFATVKSLYSGQPEDIVDHRGNAGSSAEHMHLLPHLPEYGKLAQAEVMKDGREFPWENESHSTRHLDTSGTEWRDIPARVRIKYFNGEPHVHVWRGVNGDYAERIAKQANLDKRHNVTKKLLRVPVSSLGSWTIDKSVAQRFATTRAEIPDQSKRALLLEKWLPLKNVLHCGFHKVVTNQKHAHHDEQELVFGHPEGHVKIPTGNLHVVVHRPDIGEDHYETHQVKVRPEPAKPKAQAPKAEEPELVKGELELGPQHLGKMAIPDIPPGNQLDGRTYDYSHVLSPEHRAAGYVLRVREEARDNAPFPEVLYSSILHHGKSVGGVAAGVHVADNENGESAYIEPHSDIDVAHQGQGLGTAAYEALYAHAFHKHGIGRVIGQLHSPAAGRVHEKLSDKHDIYYPVRNTGKAQRGPYTYSLDPDEEMQRSEMMKSEGGETRNLPRRHTVALAMLGHHQHAEDALAAASFLASGAPHDPGRRRQALWDHDGDHEKAALSAHGLEPSEENVKALRSVARVKDLSKGEKAPPRAQSISAPQSSGQDVVEEVERAFKEGAVSWIELGGKHSKGAMLAHDPKTDHVWLLKPGSGPQSPAAGAKEQTATQSEREAAFWHGCQAADEGDACPRAELLVIDGRQYAALRMLPDSFQTMDEIKDKDPTTARRILEPLLKRTKLHRWAALDAGMGQPDRHAQNVMAEDPRSVQQGQAHEEPKLIDAGSAFAGIDFDPAHDQASFVPYYLRAWAPDKFNLLPVQEKLKYMPRLDPVSEDVFRAWLMGLDVNKIVRAIAAYNVDTFAVEARFRELQEMASRMPADEAVNRFWVEV